MTITTNRAQNAGGNDATHRRPRTAIPVEALLSLTAGAALAGAGVWRRNWMGAALAGSGGFLLYRGARNFRRPYQGSVRVAVTIARERQQVYHFASNRENWPQFLTSLRIQPLEAGRLELRIGKPAKFSIDSRFELTDHKPGEYVAWASDQGMFEHRGVIHFRNAPASRGTEVSVALEYRARSGPIAHSLAALLGWHPEQVVRESLRHLKQLMEAGEIPTTEGQPVGASGGKGAILRVLYREPQPEPAPAPTEIAGD